MIKLKKILKDFFTYGFGILLARLISFFLIPIYTRVFTPADYGTIEMLIVISNFLGMIMFLGMDATQSNFFFKLKKQGHITQARIISAILQLRIIWGGVIILFSTILVPLINFWVFQGILSLKYFIITFVGVLFTQIMSQSAEVMRLLYRPRGFTIIILSQSILSAFLILIFIFIFNGGILGFFLGTALSTLIVAFFGWYNIKSYILFNKFHYKLWPMLLSFGLPFVPVELAFYLMSNIDRWFIMYYHGPTKLGLFAIAAKFSMIIALIVETFRKTWLPFSLDAMYTRNGSETFRLIAHVYVGCACAGVIMLTFFSPLLIKYLTGVEFHQAWPLVGVLAWQSVFYGFFTISSAGIWKSGKTYLNIYLMFFSAIISILLNWYLVPIFEGLGAAIASATAFFSYAVMSLLVSQYYWKINFQISAIIIKILLSLIFMISFLYFKPGNNLITFFSALVLSILLIFFSLPQYKNIIIKCYKNYFN
jgi:O-antigen/teichoic acid export membrane protein